jgi:hypothetical protein
VWDDTRNQPVVGLPSFDRGRISSFPPCNADRRTPLKERPLSAADGALIERRCEEIEGYSGAGAVVRFEIPEVPRRLNPPSTRARSNRNLRLVSS